MSADDDNPSDDELDREAAQAPSIGAVRHRPKLSEESRALSLRDLREEYGIERAQPEPPPPAAPEPRAPVVPIPFERLNTVALHRREADSRLRQVRDATGADAHAAATPIRNRLGVPNGGPYRDAPLARVADRSSFEAELWDKAFDAALPLVVGIAETLGQAADLAAQFADLKLEERRRRFG